MTNTPDTDSPHRPISSFHSGLLVLMADHQPVAHRAENDTTDYLSCSCGNPLYFGHLVRLIVKLHDSQLTPEDAAALLRAYAPPGTSLADCYIEAVAATATETGALTWLRVRDAGELLGAIPT